MWDLSVFIGKDISITVLDYHDGSEKSETISRNILIGETFDVHLMCEEFQYKVYFDNSKLMDGPSTLVDKLDHVTDVEIEAFDDVVEHIGYDISGHDPTSTFTSPTLKSMGKLGCRNDFTLLCARPVPGFLNFIQTYENTEGTEVNFFSFLNFLIND